MPSAPPVFISWPPRSPLLPLGGCLLSRSGVSAPGPVLAPGPGWAARLTSVLTQYISSSHVSTTKTRLQPPHRPDPACTIHHTQVHPETSLTPIYPSSSYLSYLVFMCHPMYSSSSSGLLILQNGNSEE